jgi:hypothetical protein
MFIKQMLVLIVSISCLFAGEFKINDKIENLKFKNQFEKEKVLGNDLHKIIVSFEKDISEDINGFLSSQKDSLLKDNKTVYIANISKMPSIIASLFAIPKMQKYKYDILLIDDENDQRFKAKEGKVTIYELESGVIKNIYFQSTREVIDSL